MRVFVAIRIPDDVRSALTTISDRLRRTKIHASWTIPENMHLTLRFYGEIHPSDVSQIVIFLSEQLRNFSAPLLLVRGIGAFPSLDRPLVLWAGTEVLEGALLEIQQATEQAACLIKLSPEKKPFHPHITLARIKNPVHGKIIKPLLENVSASGPPEFGREFRAHEIVLFSSTLTPKGPIYNVLREICL